MMKKRDGTYERERLRKKIADYSESLHFCLTAMNLAEGVINDLFKFVPEYDKFTLKEAKKSLNKIKHLKHRYYNYTKKSGFLFKKFVKKNNLGQYVKSFGSQYADKIKLVSELERCLEN